MYKKTVITTLMFFILLAFIDQKKPAFLSQFRNKDFNTIDLINKNNSESKTNISFSKKNIVEIKSFLRKGNLAPKKDTIHLQHNPLNTFNL